MPLIPTVTLLRVGLAEVEVKLDECQKMAKNNILVESDKILTWLEMIQKYENSIIVEKKQKL
ncbi:MAG: hypothetical protein ACOVNR_00275, partial [Chitinophagaceae bacterium]